MQESAEGFEVFVAIVEAGSISAASRSLGQPRETLSRHLARLEARLGVRLIHRKARVFRLTSAGAILYERASRLVNAAREAEDAVRRQDSIPRGLVRVSLPPGLGRKATFTSMLLTFLERYPEVELEVFQSTRYVDLIAEGIDVALRAGTTPSSTLAHRLLTTSSIIAAATPAYLATHGRPTRAEDLAHHNCLLGMGGRDRPQTQWPLRQGGHVPVSGRLAIDDLVARIGAACAGFGITLLPEGVLKALYADQLEPVLPEVVGRQGHLSLVYVERELMPPKLRAFIDHCSAWFAHDGRALLALDGLVESPVAQSMR